MLGVLISIRHKWAEKIYRREKKFELRKTAPKNPEYLTQAWRPVYIYEPEAHAVTGVAAYGSELSSWSVEQLVQLPLALTEEEIENYGPGRDSLYHAWRLDAAEKYITPFSLADFGAKRPPQSWQYIDLERCRL